MPERPNRIARETFRLKLLSSGTDCGARVIGLAVQPFLRCAVQDLTSSQEVREAIDSRPAFEWGIRCGN